MLLPKPEMLRRWLFQKLRREDLAPDIIEHLNENYGLKIYKQHQVSRRDSVHDTSTYALHSGGRKIILREHLTNTNENRLLFEHSLIDYLFENDLPVSKPIRTKNDRSFFKNSNR